MVISSPRILIVGAFPHKNKIVYGGIARSCKELIDSPLFSIFDIVTLNSSQISNPPPNVIIRAILALRRISILIFKLSFSKLDLALIFSSDGAGAIEKGVMVLLCRLYNCPSIIFPRAGNLIIQTSQSALFLKIIKFFYGRASVFLCQGEAWRKFAINNLNIDNSKVKLVSNWTATKNLLKIGKNKKYVNEEPNIVFVGWLEEQKGIWELLNACSNLKMKGLNFKLNIIGNGSIERDAKNFVIHHNLENIVSFFGWVDSSNIESILAQNDIFALPSWSEGFPNSLIEGMAAGLASVATSVGVIPDYLINNENAIIIPPKNADDLEIALDRLITDHRLRTRIALNGYELVSKNFSLENNLKKLVSIIQSKI